MSREEIQKLLGGYATGTLNDAERRALFEAALDDQELFDALANEEALRDLLRDPAARGQLIEALGPGRKPYAPRAWQWLRRPAVLAMAASAVVLALIVSRLMLREERPARQQPIVAEAIPPRTAPVPAAPAPAPRLVTHTQKRLGGGGGGGSQKPSQFTAAQPVAGLPADVVTPVPPPPPPPPAAAPAPVPQVTQPIETARQNFAVGASGDMLQMFPARAKAAKLRSASAVPYELLRADASGVYLPVAADTVLRTGDAVRFQVTARESGFLYLFRRGADSVWKLVARQAAEPGQSYAMPAGGRITSDQPARLEFMLVLSQTAEKDAQAISPADRTVTVMVEFR